MLAFILDFFLFFPANCIHLMRKDKYQVSYPTALVAISAIILTTIALIFKINQNKNKSITAAEKKVSLK